MSITVKNLTNNPLMFAFNHERPGSMGRTSKTISVKLEPGRSVDVASYCGVSEEGARTIVENTPFLTSKLIQVAGLATEVAAPASAPISVSEPVAPASKFIRAEPIAIEVASEEEIDIDDEDDNLFGEESALDADDDAE